MLCVISGLYWFHCKRGYSTQKSKNSFWNAWIISVYLSVTSATSLVLFLWLSFWILAVLQFYLNMLLGDFKIKSTGLLRSLLNSVQIFQWTSMDFRSGPKNIMATYIFLFIREPFQEKHFDLCLILSIYESLNLATGTHCTYQHWQGYKVLLYCC